MAWTRAVVMVLLTGGQFLGEVTSGQSRLSPVVFVPGKAGNQMEARLNKPSSRHPHCPVQKDWYRIWMDVWQMLPGDIDCWSENLNLVYNVTSGQASNAAGVEIRVPGWGDTTAVEYVDPSWTAWIMGNVGAYASRFIQELVTLGYTRGQDLRAAPYDFRLAPGSQHQFHADLKLLIEETYEENGQTPVLLIGHSNGGMLSLYFLNSQSQQWKDTYVRAFMTVASPFGGTPMLSLMYTTGYDWGIEAIDASVMRDQQRSYETGVFLLPKPYVYRPEEVIIITPGKNYTAHNYDEYFNDVDSPIGIVMRKNVEDAYRPKVKHPGVDTYCVYSDGQDTISSLVYKEGEFPHKIPKFNFGDGDGTVCTNSLAACETLLQTTDPNQRFVAKKINDADHLEVLSHPRFIRMVKRIATT